MTAAAEYAKFLENAATNPNGKESGDAIRTLADIPNIMRLDIPPADFLVPGLIARETITIWTGACGSAKSYLALKLAIAVATGTEFLERRCQQAPVCYLEYENTAAEITKRIARLIEPLSLTECDLDGKLFVWGGWLHKLKQQPPPLVTSEILLTIGKQERPLIIIDPLRMGHSAEENDSTQMAGVMQSLQYCAAAGCAVVALHHPGKGEGSQSRGSSVIRDHSHLCFTHELSPETGLITLTFNKNRNGGALLPITIRPNFDEGTFQVCDSPEFAKRTEESKKIAELIAAEPGLSQTALCLKYGGKKTRVRTLLDEGVGSFWQVTKDEKTKIIRYYPLVVPSTGNYEGTRELREGPKPVPPFPPSLEGTRERPLSNHSGGTERSSPSVEQVKGKTMPSCPRCGSTAIDTRTTPMTCLSCEQRKAEEGATWRN